MAVMEADNRSDIQVTAQAASCGVLLTERELAARHRRSVKTIRNLRVKGDYVPYLKIGRHVRYRLSDVLEYEAKCLRQSTSSSGGDDER
jgi:hypothetical protein